MTPSPVPPELDAWFAGRGWGVRRHQTEMLAASDAGRCALLVADTADKTCAGFLPAMINTPEIRFQVDAQLALSGLVRGPQAGH